MFTRQTLTVLTLMAGLGLAGAGPARADTHCDLRYHLEGWSAFYKTAQGGGEVTCDNGQSARIALDAKGGGFTFGASRITHGKGNFSPVGDIREIFGKYASADAHAGVGPSSAAQVVTKGPVSLAFSGTGTGVDVGFAFGRLTIAPVRARRHPRVAEAPPPRHETPTDGY